MGLIVQDLSVDLGARRVLDRVSATITPGRVTAVLGANGAGKSTLLRAMAALVPVRHGQILLDDRDVAAMPARDRAMAIGYLPQDATVHWNMRVRDLVALGRLPHRDAGSVAAGEAITAALRDTDTLGLADRPVRALSGGERARVLLARVLAGTPRWLLADEPLASLDPLHQLETLALLRAAAGQGIGVVVVLHDLTLAARVADEVILLANGGVLASGAARDVLTESNLAAAYRVAATIIRHPDGPVIVATHRMPRRDA